MRKSLWSLAAFLAFALVLCDHFTVQYELKDFLNATRYNNEQLALVYAARDCVDYAKDVQVIASRQSKEIARLQCQLARATQLVGTLKGELARTMENLEAAAETIQELTLANSELHNGREQLEQQIEILETKVRNLEARLATPAPMPDGGPT